MHGIGVIMEELPDEGDSGVDLAGWDALCDIWLVVSIMLTWTVKELEGILRSGTAAIFAWIFCLGRRGIEKGLGQASEDAQAEESEIIRS